MVQRLMSSTIAAALLTTAVTSAFAADAGAFSQETPQQWRASKLAGVPIYGPDDKRVGKITDVLMSHDGKAEYVIIGVGGFLGIGEKDVAVSYDQVVFTDEPLQPPPSTAGGTPAPATAETNAGAAPDNGTAAPNAMAAPNSGIAPATTVGLGTPSNTLDNTGAGGATSGVRSTTYPDHGRISLTVDQLKSALSFKFAS